MFLHTYMGGVGGRGHRRSEEEERERRKYCDYIFI